MSFYAIVMMECDIKMGSLQSGLSCLEKTARLYIASVMSEVPYANRKILLVFSQQDGRDRAVLSALYPLVTRRPGWSAYIIDPGRLTMDLLTGPTPLDAVIGRIEPALARALAGRLIVIATTSGCAAIEACCSVVTDNVAIGRMAADYFADRGAKHFAYVGSDRLSSRQRGDAFAARVAERGGTIRTYRGPDTGASNWTPSVVDRELTDWVRDLPVPTAVLAHNDLVAFRVSEICRHYRIAIPYAISLIGVGNDELMCRLCHPPLATIRTPNEQIGLQIAALLEQRIAGDTPASPALTLPPAGVIERQSTDTVRTDDVEVADALRYIREHAHQPITIADVVSVGFTSRRTLERRFGRVVGMSLQAAITHARVGRAKSLLAYSRRPIRAVAELSGFSSVQRFHIVFRCTTGTTPLAYRQQVQAAGLQKMTDGS